MGGQFCFFLRKNNFKVKANLRKRMPSVPCLQVVRCPDKKAAWNVSDWVRRAHGVQGHLCGLAGFAGGASDRLWDVAGPDAKPDLLGRSRVETCELLSC